MPWISRIISIALVWAVTGAAVSGCTTASERLSRRLKVGEPVSQVFFAKYDSVEAALKQAMIRYPQRVDNTEAGIFETDYVRGDSRFQPAHSDQEYSSGYRYRLLVRMVRGKAGNRNAVNVQIIKKIELARDFFSEPEPLASDGLEERAILYRINRELVIGRGIQKAIEKANREALK